MSNSSNVPKWVHLGETETVRWTGHPSLYSIGSYALLGGLLILVGVGVAVAEVLPSDLWWGAVVPVVLGVGLMIYASLVRKSVTYVVTDEEIYKKTGLLSRHVSRVPVDKVRNVSTHQSLAQRFSSRGTVVIRTTTDDGMTFDHVENLEDVSKVLLETTDR